jgi:hypothetical protein
LNPNSLPFYCKTSVITNEVAVEKILERERTVHKHTKKTGLFAIAQVKYYQRTKGAEKKARSIGAVYKQQRSSIRLILYIKRSAVGEYKSLAGE